MAVIDSRPGLEVKVKVNGKTATEYQDSHTTDAAADRTVTRYIESIDDAAFEVVAKTKSSYKWGFQDHSLVFRVYIDGKYRTGLYASQSDNPRRWRMYRVVEQKPGTATWVKRMFKFSAVNIVSECHSSRSLSEKNSLHDLGVIEVRVERCIITGDWAPANVADCSSSLEVAEKSLKGRSVSHGTAFSGEVPARPATATTYVPLATDKGPIAIFRFIYRSRESLKAELIIPRTPSPDPLAGLTVEELRRLARKKLEPSVKPESTWGPKVKREYSDHMDLTGAGSSIPMAKRTRYESPIDLTGD